MAWLEVDKQMEKMIFYTLQGDDDKVHVVFVDTNPKSPEIELNLFERSYDATEKGAGKRALAKALLLLHEKLPHKKTLTLSAVPHMSRSKTLEEKRSAQQKLNAYYTKLGFTHLGGEEFEADIVELMEQMSAGRRRKRSRKRKTRRRGTRVR